MGLVAFQRRLKGNLSPLEFTKTEGEQYMNNQELDVLNELLCNPYTNQRDLSVRTGHSLGARNADTISSKRACARASTRANGNITAFGMADKIMNY